MLGVSKVKVLRTVEQYNRNGTEWEKKRVWGVRREQRCMMMPEEEALFLKSMEEEALKGHLITYQQIRDKLEERLGRSVSQDYVWDLMKRHQWRKKVAAQVHLRGAQAAQEACKKNFLNYRRPNQGSSKGKKISGL